MIRIRMEVLNARCCVRLRARASRRPWCVRISAGASGSAGVFAYGRELLEDHGVLVLASVGV